MMRFSLRIDWRALPTMVIYLPSILLALIVGVFKRNIFFMCSANPKVFLGGLLDDSKFFILKHIPEKYKPKTIFINKSSSNFNKILQEIDNYKLKYPLVVKPDKGYAGLMVKKIENQDQLLVYDSNINIDYIIQEFIDSSLELSIFICQFRNEFTVTSLTQKEYFKLIPDGKLTVNQLITNNTETKFRQKALKRILKDELSCILPKGSCYTPIPIGNWIYGSSFIDLSNKVDKRIIETIKSLNDAIGLLKYGRYDIKTDSIEKLKEGDFKVLEINGVKAEPIHIYDKKHNILFAYKEIFRHWKYLYMISLQEKINIKFMSVLRSILRNYRMRLKYQKQ